MISGVNDFSVYAETLLTYSGSRLSYNESSYRVPDMLQVQCCDIGFCYLTDCGLAIVRDGIVVFQLDGTFE